MKLRRGVFDVNFYAKIIRWSGQNRKIPASFSIKSLAKGLYLSHHRSHLEGRIDLLSPRIMGGVGFWNVQFCAQKKWCQNLYIYILCFFVLLVLFCFVRFVGFVKVRSWQSYSKCQYSESGGKVEEELSWCETHKWNGRVGS